MLLHETLARAAWLYGRRTALVDGDVRLTYDELLRETHRLANALVGLGVRPGDRVAVLDRNCHEYLTLYYAAAAVGAVVVPLNFRLTAGELAGIADDAEPRLLFCGAEFEETAVELGVERAVVFGGAEYERLRAAAADAPPPAREASADDVIIQMYTSGTTSLPKGVLLSHRNVLTNALASVVECWRWDREGVCLTVFPIFHIAVVIPFEYVLMGGTNVLLRDFSAAAVTGLIERERVTATTLAPTMIAMLLEEADPSADLTSVRRVRYGGSAMPRPLLERTLERYPSWGFVGAYGLTEAAPLVSILEPHEHLLEGALGEARRASVGRPVLTLDVRIFDDDGELPRGAAGEVVVRGEQVMQGYWRREQETADALRGGWLHTGDVGTVDEDGYLTIVDRKKEIIVSGGENVSSREVEEALLAHPDVLEAAVVGVPDPRWVEAVAAAVRLRPGASADELELVAFARTRLGGFKVPKRLVLVDEIPKTPSGKPKKAELRERLSS